MLGVCLEGKCDFMKRPIFPFTGEDPVCPWRRGLFFTSVIFVLRTPEELRVREEDQQTITVEVELKRHDSEPSISLPQPADETRYNKPRT